MRHIIVGLLSFFCMCSGALAHSAAQIVTFNSVPEGFTEYQVQSGDTWGSITPDANSALLAMRVNRVDRRHLLPGMKVIIPDSSVAHQYVPVPRHIKNSESRELVIFLENQYFGAYENGELVHWGPISSGKNGRTRVGSFKALWKDRWHRSSKYGNAKMYFSVQYNGDYFTHEQSLPGYAASHGCVRMLKEDAAWKFDWIEVGDSITIVPSVVDVRN